MLNQYSSWLDFVRLNEAPEIQILDILMEFPEVVFLGNNREDYQRYHSQIPALNQIGEYLTSSDMDYKHIWYYKNRVNQIQMAEHSSLAKYATNYMAHNSIHKTLFGNANGCNNNHKDNDIDWKQMSQMMEQSHFIRDWKLSRIDIIIQKQIDILQSLIAQNATPRNNLATNHSVQTLDDLKINIWKRQILKLRNIRKSHQVGLEFPMNVLKFDRTEIDHIAKIAAMSGVQYLVEEKRQGNKPSLPPISPKSSRTSLQIADLLPYTNLQKPQKPNYNNTKQKHNGSQRAQQTQQQILNNQSPRNQSPRNQRIRQQPQNGNGQQRRIQRHQTSNNIVSNQQRQQNQPRLQRIQQQQARQAQHQHRQRQNQKPRNNPVVNKNVTNNKKNKHNICGNSNNNNNDLLNAVLASIGSNNNNQPINDPNINNLLNVLTTPGAIQNKNMMSQITAQFIGSTSNKNNNNNNNNNHNNKSNAILSSPQQRYLNQYSQNTAKQSPRVYQQSKKNHGNMSQQVRNLQMMMNRNKSNNASNNGNASSDDDIEIVKVTRPKTSNNNNSHNKNRSANHINLQALQQLQQIQQIQQRQQRLKQQTQRKLPQCAPTITNTKQNNMNGMSNNNNMIINNNMNGHQNNYNHNNYTHNHNHNQPITQIAKPPQIAINSNLNPQKTTIQATLSIPTTLNKVLSCSSSSSSRIDLTNGSPPPQSHHIQTQQHMKVITPIKNNNVQQTQITRNNNNYQLSRPQSSVSTVDTMQSNHDGIKQQQQKPTIIRAARKLSPEINTKNITQTYSDKKYWVQFHDDQKLDFFEWFCNYEDIRGILKHHIGNTDKKILEIGSGLSSMAAKMVIEDGYTDITCLDWCKNAIIKIKKILDKHYIKGSKHRELIDKHIKYEHLDLRDLAARYKRSRVFDVIIDKGTLDAIDCGNVLESEKTSFTRSTSSGMNNLADNFDEIVAICTKVHELLKPGGLFVIVTSRSVPKRTEFVDEVKTLNSRLFQRVYGEKINTKLRDWRDGDSNQPKLIILKAIKTKQKRKKRRT